MPRIAWFLYDLVLRRDRISLSTFPQRSFILSEIDECLDSNAYITADDARDTKESQGSSIMLTDRHDSTIVNLKKNLRPQVQRRWHGMWIPCIRPCAINRVRANQEPLVLLNVNGNT